MPMSKGKGEVTIQSHEWTRRETLSRRVCRQLTFLSLTTEKIGREMAWRGRSGLFLDFLAFIPL